MKAGETTLNDLIVRGDRQYQVPLYQRPYTWRLENWAQLWTDVLDQYYILKRGSKSFSHSAHFFGSFVLAPFNVSARSAPSFLVVDGQQRLTTVFLLLAALRDTASANDPKDRASYHGVLVNDRARRDEDRPRLVPTQSDRPAFEAIIDGRPEDAGTSKIAEAYRFFLAQLAREDEDGDPLDLEAMQRVVLDRLAVVEITADRDDNPHRIFESLNARGVPLTQADLLRNYIFMLLPTRGERLYREVWLPMQEELGAAHMVGLARVDLQRRGIDANLGDVYRLQQERLSKLSNDEAALEVQVRDLVLRARYYRCFVEPPVETDSELRASLERLRHWGAQTTYPLLMHLYSLRGDGKATTAQLRRCLSFIESFLVRRYLVGVSTNQLNRLFADAVRQLNAELPVDDALRELLSRERRYWPTDEQVRQAVVSRNFYFSGRAEQRKLILQRLEESFAHKEPVDVKAARPTVEHIMPQTLTDEWRQHLLEHGDDPEAVQTELLHTLGNLTLSAYNAELSNKVFERKQQMYSASHFELNRSLAESPNWTSKEIHARGEALARRVVAIWPGPLTSGAGAPDATDWGRVASAIALIPESRTCTVEQLAVLVPCTSEALETRLRSSPTQFQRGLERVIDQSGHPLRLVGAPPSNARRPITAYELAQLMPFEFDNEEMKAIRRRRSPVVGAASSGSVDVRMLTAFLRSIDGVNAGVFRTLHKRIWDMRCTPQQPVDWSNPDQWIAERLEGPEKELALAIWTRSGKVVNPRYLRRPRSVMNRLGLATTVNGRFSLTDQGRALLGGDLSVLEGVPDAPDGGSRDDVFFDFWTLLLGRPGASESRFAGAHPHSSQWMAKNAGMRGARYVLTLRQYDTVGELYIDDPDRQINIRILERLREHQVEIETAFGGSLNWDVKLGRRSTRVAATFDTGGYLDSEAFEEIADELLDGFSRFEGALQPYIDAMVPGRTTGSNSQARDEAWTEAEYLTAVRVASLENAVPAEAILRWAHQEARVMVEGSWGAQNAGLRLRTARPDDKSSEHSFINLNANSADTASAEVQFASMARREPYVDRDRRLDILAELNAIATVKFPEVDVDMRVPFRLRDLRNPQHLEAFLDIWRHYLDEFHSAEFAHVNTGSVNETSVEHDEAVS